MTKVLQLRRGTTAQHNAFIGMDGEVTVDTNAQTLCVHDGVTTGGYPLARADLSNIDHAALATAVGGIMDDGAGENGTSAGFDINTVPRDFWKALFREHNIISGNFAQSGAYNIIPGAYMEYVFDIDVANFNTLTAVTDVILVNQGNDAGYAPGDVVYAFGIGTRTSPRPITFADINGVHLRLLMNDDAVWVSHKTDGGAVNINNNNWKIVFRVWY